MSGDPVELLLKAGLIDATVAQDLDVLTQRLRGRVEAEQLSLEQATRVLTNHFKRACDAFETTHGALTAEQSDARTRVAELVPKWLAS